MGRSENEVAKIIFLNIGLKVQIHNLKEGDDGGPKINYQRE